MDRLLNWLDRNIPHLPPDVIDDLFLDREGSIPDYRTADSRSDTSYRTAAGVVIPFVPPRGRELTLFETSDSFFRSGRYRPTAEQGRDRDTPPSKVTGGRNRGMYTGAARPDPLKVFRRFGGHTRSRVMPYRRYNRMDAESGFADDVVGSKSVPSLLNPAASLGQSGSEAVLTASRLSRTLGVGKPGSTHPILDG